MINPNHQSILPRMITTEYTANVDAKTLQAAAHQAIKSPQRIAGATIEKGLLVITDIVRGVQARVICDVPGTLRIIAPAEMQPVVSELCRRLMGQGIISPKRFVAKARVDEVKPCIPASEVFATHMKGEDFAKWITVLPEALQGAAECKFRNDGALVRYLANLLRFAKDVFDEANIRKPLKHVARNCGLSHFSEGISETARRKYPEDYTAIYDGAPRIFPMHVTIGAGHQETDCMSIHFLVDRQAGRLVIARFGRHGRGEGKP